MNTPRITHPTPPLLPPMREPKAGPVEMVAVWAGAAAFSAVVWAGVWQGLPWLASVVLPVLAPEVAA